MIRGRAERIAEQFPASPETQSLVDQTDRPLNVAAGRLELVREEVGNEHLDRIADANSRVEEIIADILTLARQGEPTGETEPVQVAALARGCWEVVDTTDATLQIEDEMTVMADRDRLQQLLEKFLRNAIQHDGEAVAIRLFLSATLGPSPRRRTCSARR